MPDKIFWVSVEFDDHYPTEEEIERITETLKDESDDHRFIVASKEVKPIDSSELVDYFESAIEELKQD